MKDAAVAELRWGLIGASDIDATRLIPSWGRPSPSFTGVVTADAERGARHAPEHPIPDGTTDVGQLVAKQGPLIG